MSMHAPHRRSGAVPAASAQLPGISGSLPAPVVGAEDAHTAPLPTTAGEQAEAAIRDRALALAVIRQAIADATATKLYDPRRSGGNARAVTAEEREEARLFLTGGGQWAVARRLWCDAAGVTPGWLERCAARMPVLEPSP
ncbi:hypothetical protein M0638_27850 [Roseomonas sp. NAR14]|uniref:Uncharacterized protein n=1 Tax=Roseomonas acroporae TaxID=2937791 RepID=A0A9X1YE56_9PROT|nr:hypothetical protein [Roseomonas acroporae]MCK8788167.1 hypothetical protein [Roseomonas acroporae]